MDKEERVPVISLKELHGKGRREEVAREVGEACKEWGFFQIVDHGVDEELVEGMFEQGRAFFALPKEEKRLVERTAGNSKGYYDKELTKQRVDWKEVFDFGAQEGVQDAAGLDGCNQWPRAPPGFREALCSYYARVHALSLELFRVVIESLPMDDAEKAKSAGLLEDAFAKHSSFLRLNHYPPCPEADCQLGISPHTDAGALTVLAQTDVQSLQVLRGGAWVDVHPLAGAFVVNIGDVVQVLSNDRYRAPLHRVKAHQAASRLSAPFFLNPDYAFTYKPLLSSSAEAPAFRPICWGDFRLARSAGDYADLGEEIQIDHFRISKSATSP